MAMTALDLTGQRYGRLVAVENTGEKRRRNYLWKFMCDCGNTVIIASGEVRSGKTMSCGCLRKDLSTDRMKEIQHLGAIATTTHGMTGKATFICWDSMKQRCLNSEHKSFKDYGGRGIKVCDRWLESFESFLKDMGERPEDMTLDRKDVNGNYELENCRWATRMEQANNRRTNRLVEMGGITKTITQWAREYKIGPKTLLYRLNQGMDIKEALTMKVFHGNTLVSEVEKF